MAERNHRPLQPDGFRGFHDDSWPVMSQRPGPLPNRPAALEELEMQHREIQMIVAENRLVIDDNTLLRRELTVAKDEVHRLGQAIPTLRAEKEARTRDLMQRGLKLEADVRATGPLKAEVVQLREEVQKLNTSTQDLSSQVQGLTKYVNRLKAENQKLISMRTDIDGLHKELVEARRVYEYEKKSHEEQVKQKQVLETDLVSMAREAEKLRAQCLVAEGRSRELGFVGYEMSNGNLEMRNQAGAFRDSYGSAWGHYDRRGAP